jgi:hypothetical protein
METRQIRVYLTYLALIAITAACSVSSSPPISPTNTLANDGAATVTPTVLLPSPTEENIVASNTPQITSTTTSLESCSLGLGLRRETAEILRNFRDYPGFVMSANLQLAVTYFPELDGWIRSLGAPSLEELEIKAARALDENLEFEGLSYGLETSVTTPEDEWTNLISSTEQARNIADSFAKLLVMGPGFRLMSKNEDSYPGMAAQSHIWMIQTQRLQVNPPGDVYRQEVERIINLVREGNPTAQIWAQITFLPDRPPDAAEWLAYRQAIQDLVDGTFIGVYTWDSEDPEVLKETINLIFEEACMQTEE